MRSNGTYGREKRAGDPLEELRIPQVKPDPVFRADLRNQLLASAASRETATAAQLAPARPRRRGPMLTAGAVLTVALVSTHLATCLPREDERHWPFTQSANDSGRAEPGAERARGAKELGAARERAGRLITLAADREPDPMALIDAFRQMDGHTRAASDALTRVYARTGDRAPLAQLVAFSRAQRTRLQPMMSQLPITALLPAVESMALICGISKQTRTLLGVRAVPSPT